jgi:hypothetical protein
MRRMWATGVAIVVCLALGGVPVAGQDASPHGMTSQVLYQITVPATAMPVGLVKIPVDQWTVDPGVDTMTQLGNEAMRGRGCLVRSGTFVVRPATDSLVWRAADAVGGRSTVAPAGEPVTLETGDVLLLPAIPDDQVDPAAEVGLANPGDTEAVVFCFHMHQPGGQFSGWPDGFESTVGVTHSHARDMELTATGDAVLRLTQLTAPAGSAISLPKDAAYAFYIADQGKIASSAGGPTFMLGSGTVLRAESDPPTQVNVVGDSPAVILELAVIPSASGTPATPTPASPSSSPATRTGVVG